MKTKEKIQLTFTGVLVLCALVITALVIRQQLFPSQPQPRARQVESWQELKLTGYRSGPTDAAVQIIEFFDYQCPFCKSVQPTVRAVQQKYPEKVSVVHEHFPLSDHQYAFEAAVAAECARNQGKFEAYHKLLFANQDRLDNLSYKYLAKKVGVQNLSAFKKCIKTQATGGKVVAGLNLAKKLNLSAIPAFLINGKLVTGALSEQQLTALVEEALANAKE